MANQEIVRRNRMLVRRRDGFLPSGESIGVGNEAIRRPAHVVLLSTFPDAYINDLTPGTVNVDNWSTCCGVVFVPGTAEVVNWADQMPHQVCAKKSGLPLSAVQRMHDEARESDIALRLKSGHLK